MGEKETSNMTSVQKDAVDQPSTDGDRSMLRDSAPPSDTNAVFVVDTAFDDSNRDMVAMTTSSSSQPLAQQPPLLKRTTSNGSLAPTLVDDDLDSQENWVAFEVEPGVDVQRAQFYDIFPDVAHAQPLGVTVADWNKDRVRVQQDIPDKDAFIRWLHHPRPAWSKARWINLDGLQWSLFKELALKYELHPLAVEDCLHVFDKNSRSKIDFYINQIFMRLVLLQLEHDDDDQDSSDSGSSSSSEDSDSEIEHVHQRAKQPASKPVHLAAASATAQHHSSNAQPGPSRTERKQHHAMQARLRGERAAIQSTVPSPRSGSRTPLLGGADPTSTAGHHQSSYGTTDAAFQQYEPAQSISESSRRQQSADRVLQVSRMTGRLSAVRSRRMSTFPNGTSTLSKGKSQSGSGTAEDNFLSRISSRFRRRSGSSESGKSVSRRSIRQNQYDEEDVTGLNISSTERDPFLSPTTTEERRHTDQIKEETEAGLQAITSDNEDTEAAVHYAARVAVKNLTEQYRVAWQRQTLSCFLTKDGTVISIWSKDGGQVVPSILARLRSRDTLLRSTEDPSMLLQAILDTIVDRALDLADAFRRKLVALQGTALVAPQVATVRQLLVLRDQLSTMRLVMNPLQNLVASLRSSEDGRDSRFPRVPSTAANTTTIQPHRAFDRPHNVSVSPMAIQYLADVYDHIDSVMASTESAIASCEQLEGFLFNMINFSANETMKQLTIVSIIFLPLTFLSGYYGMNFTEFGQLNSSVFTFWSIAIPVTFGIVALLALPDISRLVKTLKHKAIRARAIQRRSKRIRERRKSQ